MSLSMMADHWLSILGDSMTFGWGLPEADAFPARLGELQPTVTHANYGVCSVGTDFEYLLLQQILADHAPAVVVLHVYVGNDVYDIDRPYECCAGRPLLDYSSTTLRAACDVPRWGFTLTARVSRSPPPYPLRAATAWSDAARHLSAAFSRATFQLDRSPNFVRSEGEASELGWTHFERIVREMRDQLRARGSDLMVNLLPDRRAIQSEQPLSSPSYKTRERIGALTAELGIRTLDAWDLFEEAIKRDGDERYFFPGDIHFSPEGHRLLASWLAERLPAPGQP